MRWQLDIVFVLFFPFFLVKSWSIKVLLNHSFVPNWLILLQANFNLGFPPKTWLCDNICNTWLKPSDSFCYQEHKKQARQRTYPQERFGILAVWLGLLFWGFYAVDKVNIVWKKNTNSQYCNNLKQWPVTRARRKREVPLQFPKDSGSSCKRLNLLEEVHGLHSSRQSLDVQQLNRFSWQTWVGRWCFCSSQNMSL